MVFLGYQHRLQRVQRTLLLLVRHENSALLAVKRTVNAGHRSELKLVGEVNLIRNFILLLYLAKDIPNVALGQALVVDECDGIVAELVCLDVTRWCETK